MAAHAVNAVGGGNVLTEDLHDLPNGKSAQMAFLGPDILPDDRWDKGAPTPHTISLFLCDFSQHGGHPSAGRFDLLSQSVSGPPEG